MTVLEESTDSPMILGFLAAIAEGRGADLAAFYAPDATVDLTVPNWRFRRHGSASIAAELAHWFADPGSFDELRVLPTASGFTLAYLLAWEEGGVPHAAHHCHVMEVVDERIVRDTVFCGGRWTADLLARMEEAPDGG